MITEQVFNYVKHKIEQGVSQEEIKKILQDTGWREDDISQVFDAVANPDKQVVFTPQVSAGMPGAMDLFEQAWGILQKRFWYFLGVAMVPVATIFVFGLVVALFFALNLFSSSASIALIVFVIIASICSIVISIWSKLALFFAIKDRQENINIKETYRRSWKKIGSFAWVSLLGISIILTGFAFFLVPGIIFYVWFFATSYILISENETGMNALLKSREYVRGNWWDVCMKLLVGGIVGFVVAVVAQSIPSLLIGVGDQPNIVQMIILGGIGFIIYLAIAVLVGVFLTIYTVLIYENLKSLKPNFIFTPNKRDKIALFAASFIGCLIVAFYFFAMVAVISDLNKGKDIKDQNFDKIHSRGCLQGPNGMVCD